MRQEKRDRVVELVELVGAIGIVIVMVSPAMGVEGWVALRDLLLSAVGL